MRVTALIYHDVLADGGSDDSGFPGPAALSYKLVESQFRGHLELLATRAQVSEPRCLSEDFRTAVEDGALVLTFDDGGTSAASRISPALRERSWRAHFFVTTGLIGTRGFMNASQLREVHSAGHVLGTHSASHPARMSALAPEAMLREWHDSRARLEDILGAPVHAASVPGGYFSRPVAQAAAQAGIRLLFTSEPQRSLQHLEGVVLIGRFSVTRSTSAADLVSLATGGRRAALRQRLSWETKKLLKRLGGERWLAARRWFFERRAR